MDVLDPLLTDTFDAVYAPAFSSYICDVSHFAVACSGGPDSLALTYLLSDWAARHGKRVYVLIVDHQLRPESSREAQEVAAVVGGFRAAEPFVLAWEGDKPDTRIQETARGARYDLIAAHCREYGARHVFLGHHADDQAETVLFRLAKGSGLDGLCGMRTVQESAGGLTLLRPFLDVPKARLVDTCRHYDLSFAEDPSNCSPDYARVRMRGAQEVLAAEGLTPKRIGVTAKRLARAQEALDFYAGEAFEATLIEEKSDRFVFDILALKALPFESVLRIVLRVFDADAMTARPRMERVESLVHDVMFENVFRKRTLGGFVFERDDDARQLRITHEE